MKKFEGLVKIVSEIVPDDGWDKVKDLIPDVRREIKPVYNMMLYASEIRYRDFAISRNGVQQYVACYMGYSTFGKEQDTAGRYLRVDNHNFENWKDKNAKSYLWQLGDLIKYIDELHGDKYD